MNKIIIYGLIAGLLGLSRVWFSTPWWLIIAPVWSPVSTILIFAFIKRMEKYLPKLKQRLFNRDGYYKGKI